MAQSLVVIVVIELSPFVSFSDSESVITLERAMDGSVLAANIAAAPPINMSLLVKFAMCPLLPGDSIHADTCSTID